MLRLPAAKPPVRQDIQRAILRDIYLHNTPQRYIVLTAFRNLPQSKMLKRKSNLPSPEPDVRPRKRITVEERQPCTQKPKRSHYSQGEWTCFPDLQHLLHYQRGAVSSNFQRLAARRVWTPRLWWAERAWMVPCSVSCINRCWKIYDSNCHLQIYTN